MIAYLEGTLFKKEEERIILLVNHIGYEIVIPAMIMTALHHCNPGDDIALYIYYHQTDRQPKPSLIGFKDEVEKDFFQEFISVEDIGPMKAVKALTFSIADIAGAIEAGDAAFLKQLKGIGARTAGKIIATLGGKMDRFIAVSPENPAHAGTLAPEIVEQVLNVLVTQLGHKMPEAKQLIAKALERNTRIVTAEDLFDEIYRHYQKP